MASYLVIAHTVLHNFTGKSSCIAKASLCDKASPPRFYRTGTGTSAPANDGCYMEQKISTYP